MKTWIKRSLIAVLGAGILFGGLAACAGHSVHHGGSMSDDDVARLRERVISKATRELDLDPNQQARLGALADALSAQRKTWHAGGEPRAELESLVAGSRFDRSKAQALVDAKTGLVRDQAPVLIAAFGDFYDSLNAGQQQKLREFMERGGHHHWMHG